MTTNIIGVDDPLTRRQFFARLRRLGFSKSGIRVASNGLTYRKSLDSGVAVLVTVPKGHESTFQITGRVPYSGIYILDRLAADNLSACGNYKRLGNRNPTWGTPVVPEDLFCNNMLEVCLGILSGDITVGMEQAY